MLGFVHKNHKDEYKRYITIIDNSKENAKMKCNFCLYEFYGRPMRANAHLAGLDKQGVQACNKIPDGIKQAFIAKVWQTSDSHISDEQITAQKKSQDTRGDGQLSSALEESSGRSAFRKIYV